MQLQNNEPLPLSELDNMLNYVNWNNREAWIAAIHHVAAAYHNSQEAFDILQAHSIKGRKGGSDTEDRKHERREYFHTRHVSTGLGALINHARQNGYTLPKRERKEPRRQVISLLGIVQPPAPVTDEEALTPEQEEARCIVDRGERWRANTLQKIAALARQILGGIMLTDDATGRFEWVVTHPTIRKFMPEPCAAVYAALDKYLREKREFTLPGFSDWCGKLEKPMSENDIAACCAANSYNLDAVDEAAEQMIALSQRVITYQNMKVIALAAIEGPQDFGNLFEQSAGEIAVSRGLPDLEGGNIAAAALEINEAMKPANRHKLYIPTGFRILDDAFYGMRRREISLYLAQTGKGKTWWAISIVCNLLRARKRGGAGYRIAFFSLEMDQDSIAYRLYQAYSCHTTGELQAMTEFGKVLDAFRDDLDASGISIITSCMDIAEIESKMAMLTASAPVDLMIIDYQQLIGNEGYHSLNEYEKQNNTCRRLKQLAIKHNCAVLSLAQTPKPRYDKSGRQMDVSLYDIAGSSGIARDVALVLTPFYTEELDNATVADVPEGTYCGHPAVGHLAGLRTLKIRYDAEQNAETPKLLLRIKGGSFEVHPMPIELLKKRSKKAEPKANFKSASEYANGEEPYAQVTPEEELFGKPFEWGGDR